MQNDLQSIKSHYTQADLNTTILTALQHAGKDIEALTRDDISVFDEFHIGGRRATRALAQLIAPLSDKIMLDVGCGVGGPARTLAAEFGCQVIGLELVDAYCQAAHMLTSRVGLDDKVSFQPGSALDLPFDDRSFDIVWTQHLSMNIEDKIQLFSEIGRVLRPGGGWALYEACSGAVSPLHFPVPWAGDSSISFLLPPVAMRQQIKQMGFVEHVWNDLTLDSLAWFQKTIATRASAPPSPLGIQLISGSDFAEKGKNVVRNLAEQRLSIIQAVFKRKV